MFLNLRHNSEHVDAVINGTGRPLEKKDFQVFKHSKQNHFLSKSKFFLADVHCMKCRIRWENKNFDDRGILIQAKSEIQCTSALMEF